jgi:hypothetical protein
MANFYKTEEHFHQNAPTMKSCMGGTVSHDDDKTHDMSHHSHMSHGNMTSFHSAMNFDYQQKHDFRSHTSN